MATRTDPHVTRVKFSVSTVTFKYRDFKRGIKRAISGRKDVMDATMAAGYNRPFSRPELPAPSEVHCQQYPHLWPGFVLLRGLTK